LVIVPVVERENRDLTNNPKSLPKFLASFAYI
jgi:hypothetical protein